MVDRIPVSVMILTKNEEVNISDCLATLTWSDDVHVFDSCSTDQTVAISEAWGAKVTQRQFDNWSAHQNWGLQNISFKYDWVFYIDSDESLSSAATEEIRKIVSDPNPKYLLYRIPVF